MNFWMWIFSALLILSACGVVFSAKPLNSAFSLVVTLFLVAVHFALLEAHFLAVLQVMVYAGAIMVLIVFVIMLLGLRTTSETPLRKMSFVTTICLGAYLYFIGLLFWSLRGLSGEGTKNASAGIEGGVHAVGQLLFGKYLFPFEVISVLLLAAAVGAVVLAQEAKRGLPAGRGLKAKRTH